tara:strand:- start:224 stop:622 length:399 start_codon:yes stop_codon:yes gene_type:complete
MIIQKNIIKHTFSYIPNLSVEYLKKRTYRGLISWVIQLQVKSQVKNYVVSSYYPNSNYGLKEHSVTLTNGIHFDDVKSWLNGSNKQFRLNLVENQSVIDSWDFHGCSVLGANVYLEGEDGCVDVVFKYEKLK